MRLAWARRGPSLLRLAVIAIGFCFHSQLAFADSSTRQHQPGGIVPPSPLKHGQTYHHRVSVPRSPPREVASNQRSRSRGPASEPAIPQYDPHPQQPGLERGLARRITKADNSTTASSASASSASSASSSQAKTPAPTPTPTPPVHAPSGPTPSPVVSPTPVPTEQAQAPTREPTPAPSPQPTPAPLVTRAPATAAVEVEPTPGPTAVVSTPAPSLLPTGASSTPAPSAAGTVVATTSAKPASDDTVDADNKVATPYFMDASTHHIQSVTFHIQCDTEGAIIRYTLDGSDPAPTASSSSVQEVEAGESVFVHEIGSVTIRAVAIKEGMDPSDEVSKTVEVQDRVEDPELYFDGEHESNDADNQSSFLRTVAITMNCSTPNATIHYTTDGDAAPEQDSPSVAPGTRLQWSEEGTTKFKVVAFADGLYRSEVTTWEVTIVAPRTDEHALPDGSSASGAGVDMTPAVEVTAFEAAYAAPGTVLEQEEQLGPGFGGECEGGARTVRGKLLRVFNPGGHLSFVPPPGSCGGDGGDDDDGVALERASITAGAFEPIRETVSLLDGESPEDARVRLDLDAREEAWRAAGGNGCQAVAAGGLLGGGGGDGACVVGHLVGGGNIFRAEEGTGLVSFGVRGGSYVVGVVTADEVNDKSNPFQNLVSGAGWLVRAGVNHVEASARDGHLDILRDGSEDSEGDDEKASGLGDVLTAKLARTAIGHDAEGRLILLQTSGAAAGADQDTSIPDGLDLFELADVLVEAGAVNAVNLVGGAPAAMTVNGSAIVAPAEACSDLADSAGFTSVVGFAEGSILPRCERPVSSIVCVHLNPPPLVAGATGSGGGGGSSPAPSGSSPPSSGGDDWGGAWSSSSSGSGDGGGKEDVRLQWAQDLCANNGTGNATDLWKHLDDVEESVSRYKIAFWVAAGLGMMSLYFNIQHQRSSGGDNSNGAGRGGSGGGLAYGRQLEVQGKNVGLINGGIVATTGVEMAKLGGGKRGSRKSSSRRRGSSGGGGGYARVNGDATWDGDDGGVGVYGADSEEEVDLGLAPPRPPSSRRRDKKGSRLKRALAKVSKGGGGTSAPGHGDGDLDASMAINPFGGGAGVGLPNRDEGGSYDWA